MIIDYGSYDFLVTECTKAMSFKQEFTNQVMKDGGKVFFGLVSPGGLRMTLELDKTKTDKD